MDFPLSSTLWSAKHDVVLTRYCAVISLVCTVWEYLITIDQEITLIWTGRPFFSIARLMFRFSRYGLICSLIYANTGTYWLTLGTTVAVTES
ncbi:hypothetical protein BDW22DRAFT_1359286 [Trametopsis cervina]|nr:hypothetical protein BDW22DRAFT_1359286 [Trametopsis cervina]